MPASNVYRDEDIARFAKEKLDYAEHRVFVARYFGRDLRMPSGKSCWASIGAAKNAVNLALESIAHRLEKGDYIQKDKARDALKNWIARNIEFKELR